MRARSLIYGLRRFDLLARDHAKKVFRLLRITPVNVGSCIAAYRGVSNIVISDCRPNSFCHRCL
jgi:hypothetical protein